MRPFAFSWGTTCETCEWTNLAFFLHLQLLHEKVKGVCVYGGGGGVVHVVVLLQFEFRLTYQILHGELEINVFIVHNSGTGRRSSLLGKIVIPINIMHNKPTNIVRWYLLLKCGLFSNIKRNLRYSFIYHLSYESLVVVSSHNL
jgi:hypothetical protein